MPNRVKPPFVIFDTNWGSDARGCVSECPDITNYKWRLNPVWHRKLYPYGNSGRQRVKGNKRV